jgi:hypothetical protein
LPIESIAFTDIGIVVIDASDPLSSTFDAPFRHKYPEYSDIYWPEITVFAFFETKHVTNP